MSFWGKPSYHADADNGWEPFSAAEEPEDYCKADWENIIDRAREIGAHVKATKQGLKITYGQSEGIFKDYRGGVKMAERFLEEIA